MALAHKSFGPKGKGTGSGEPSAAATRTASGLQGAGRAAGPLRQAGVLGTLLRMDRGQVCATLTGRSCPTLWEGQTGSDSQEEACPSCFSSCAPHIPLGETPGLGRLFPLKDPKPQTLTSSPLALPRGPRGPVAIQGSPRHPGTAVLTLLPRAAGWGCRGIAPELPRCAQNTAPTPGRASQVRLWAFPQEIITNPSFF